MTAVEHLKSHGIRPSVQRIAVMNYLLEHRTHPTVDDIYVNLAKQMPTLSRTTVYNTLELLVEHNAVLELTIDGSKAHYDGYTEAHSHFLCKDCGKIYDLPVDAAVLEMLKPKGGFEIETTNLYYSGRCAECCRKNNITNN